MQIFSQNIHGGSQQFADTIVNQYQNATFGQNDIELLKFIAGLKTTYIDQKANFKSYPS